MNHKCLMWLPFSSLNNQTGKADCTNGEIFLDEDSKAVLSGSSWQVCRRMIYVPRSAQKGFAVGFWPIPEAFWPDVNAPSLVRQFYGSLTIVFTCKLLIYGLCHSLPELRIPLSNSRALTKNL